MRHWIFGGPTDIVVEPNIVRAIPARDQMTQRGPAGEGSGRSAPVTDTPARSEPDLLDPVEPVLPEPSLRPTRPSFADDVRRAAPRTPDAAPAPMPDPVIRPEPRADAPSRAMPRPEPRPEPVMSRPSRIDPPLPPLRPRPSAAPTAPAPAPAAATPAASDAEKNLAEMAQRLEAALRGPGATESRPEPRIGAPPVAPEAPRGRAGPEASPAAPPVTPPTKTGFENLEDEMASLLGRPKSPS